MKLKNNFYITYENGKFILTNIDTRIMYEMDNDTFCQLIDPNVATNQTFIEADIVGNDDKQNSWPFSSISHFFFNSILLKEEDMKIVDYKQWWIDYLYFCEDKLKINKAIQKENNVFETISLPEHRQIQGSLYNALKNRRTIMEFNGQAITLQELSDILYITFAKFHNFECDLLDNDNLSWRRTSPSAGAMHPISAYVLINNVENLGQGIYLYDHFNHQLKLLKKEYDVKELTLNLINQDFHIGSAFNAVTVGDLNIVKQKYSHSIGSLFPYLDNGHLAQTLMLVATALNLQCWICAALCHEYFSKLLQLESYQIPITLLAIGHGPNEALGPRAKKTIAEICKEKMLIAEKCNAKQKKKLMLPLNIANENDIDTI